MDLNFFSWNVKNNENSSFYIKLAKELKNSRIDILVLQECYEDLSATVPVFKEIIDFAKEKGSNTLRIFLNTESELAYDIATSYVNNKQRCVLITTKKGFKFNLVGVHLYSKAGGKSSMMQAVENSDVGKNLLEFSLRSHSNNTVIVGDFNYLPFDVGLKSPFTLNAIQAKQVIRDLVNRRLAQRDYPFFYNPMWNILGDYDFLAKKEKIAGTYYRHSEDPEDMNWNLIDGVVLSKDIMDNIDIESLHIVTSINGQSLLNEVPKGKKKTYLKIGHSDHLPIKFTLKTT